jgi:hypothetical protein
VKPLFFVACVPRSGSQWLAQLLDTVPGVKCYHINYLVKKKVLHTDIQFMLDAWKGQDIRPYLRESRGQVARFAEQDAPGMRGWGEVNECIRYSVSQMREVFDVPIAGLIRSGPMTTPSLVRHHFYNPAQAGEWTSAIEPLDRLARGMWPDATQFARCCWLWADSYQRLLDQGVPIFTLESLNAEFGNVERLCDVLGISVSYEDWQERAGKPVDAFYVGRPRPPLPPDKLETFNRWAGDIQEYFYG